MFPKDQGTVYGEKYRGEEIAVGCIATLQCFHLFLEILAFLLSGLQTFSLNPMCVPVEGEVTVYDWVYKDWAHRTYYVPIDKAGCDPDSVQLL